MKKIWLGRKVGVILCYSYFKSGLLDHGSKTKAAVESLKVRYHLFREGKLKQKWRDKEGERYVTSL